MRTFVIEFDSFVLDTIPNRSKMIHTKQSEYSKGSNGISRKRKVSKNSKMHSPKKKKRKRDKLNLWLMN